METRASRRSGAQQGGGGGDPVSARTRQRRASASDAHQLACMSPKSRKSPSPQQPKRKRAAAPTAPSSARSRPSRVSSSSAAASGAASGVVSFASSKRRRTAHGKPDAKPDATPAREPAPVDPLTLEPIPADLLFTFTRPNGSVAHFCAPVLADYMLSSGDFSDPLTRLPLSPADLARLDAAAGTAASTTASASASSSASASAEASGASSSSSGAVSGGARGRASVHDAAARKAGAYAAQRCDRNAVLGLERFLGEQVADMLALVDDVNDGRRDVEAAEMRMHTELLPTFRANLKLLQRVDAQAARSSMTHFLQFVRGPPNRPTRNEKGYRDRVLRLLRLVQMLAHK